MCFALILESIVVYFDDILVFSKTMKEHIDHVKAILQTLRKERLYVNLKKMHVRC